ncbi:MAG TPA: aminotransferase class V-fold PLP-dependent enzyme [Azospirillaceae bacterium]|nr:aminotransferase class V-fold PLP-dependent enzyme [Azospirillaceae bacterium]
MDEANRRLYADAHRRALAYMEGIAARRVYPDGNALAGLSAFDEALPEQPLPPEDTLRLLDEVGGPATVASTGGRYFGFVVGGSLPVALAADWLVSAWDQCATMPVSSPVSAKVEQVAGRWMTEILGLPTSSAVAFVTGASMGNLLGLAAARHHLLRRLGYDVESQGLFGAPRLRVVASAEIHSTLVKDLGILGFGRDCVERVPTDAQGRLIPEELPELDDRTIVCVQAGNVNSGSFDPFRAVVAKARAAGAWVHVDGAFGLWAAASPRLRALVDGIEGADSWVTDGHKWLNVPYDCGVVVCRHPDALRGAMGLSAAYMPTGEAVPAKDLLAEFSRRARGIPVWAALRTLGRQGVADMVERNCAQAQRMAAGLRALGAEILNDVVLNQIVVSFGDAERTAHVQRAVEQDGACWFGPTQWQGRAAVRISISSWATTDEDIDGALAAIGRILGEGRVPA